LRIAFITYEFPPASGKGGIGTYTRQMAIALAAKRWDVHVFSGCSTPSATYVEDGYHLHLSKCENGNDFRHKVVKSFSDEQAINPFDLIESPEINGNAWEVKKKYPTIPLIVRLHAPNYLVETLKKNTFRFLQNFVLSWDLSDGLSLTLDTGGLMIKQTIRIINLFNWQIL